MKIMKFILPIILILAFSGCELTMIYVDKWNNGLNVEIDKTTGIGRQVEFNNLTGETIKSIIYKVVAPSFDEKDPDAEPSSWSDGTNLVSNLSNSGSITNTLTGVSNLDTVFFKVEAESGRYVIFALVPEDNTKYRVNTRKSK